MARQILHHAVLFYGRYRDDIIILQERGDVEDGRFGVLARKLRGLTCNFKLEQWEISQFAMVHLDTELYKLPGCSTLKYRPHFKPSSLGVPLSCSSHHPPHTHISWTKSEIVRLCRLSSTREDFNDAKSTFLARMEKFNMDARIISKLRIFDPTFL
jgi:hypothetical protein